MSLGIRVGRAELVTEVHGETESIRCTCTYKMRSTIWAVSSTDQRLISCLSGLQLSSSVGNSMTGVLFFSVNVMV